MKRILTENRLHRIITESVKHVLQESKQGLQSPKLYQITKEHGGLGDNRPGLGHGMHHRAYGNFSNLTDDDIIGVFSYGDVQNMYQNGHNYDHGRWGENDGLRLYAKEHGFNFNGADEVSQETLGDGSILLYIDRGGRFDRNSLYQHKDGDWKDYYNKTELRRINRQLKPGDNHPTRPIQKAAKALRDNPYIWSQKHDEGFQWRHGNDENYGNGWTNAIRHKAIDYARQGKDAWGYDIDR